MNVLYVSKDIAIYMIRRDVAERFPNIPVMPGDIEMSVIRMKQYESEYKLKGGDTLVYMKSKRKFALKAY